MTLYETPHALTWQEPRLSRTSTPIWRRVLGVTDSVGESVTVDFEAMAEDQIDGLLFLERLAEAGGAIGCDQFEAQTAKLETTLKGYLSRFNDEFSREDFENGIVYFLRRDINIFEKIRQNNTLHDRPTGVTPQDVISAYVCTLEGEQVLESSSLLFTPSELYGEYSAKRQHRRSSDHTQ